MRRGSLGDDACMVETPHHLQRSEAPEYAMTMSPAHHRLRIVACPEPGCDAAAEVVDQHTFRSTNGPVPMLRTRCLGKHVRDWVDIAA